MRTIIIVPGATGVLSHFRAAVTGVFGGLLQAVERRRELARQRTALGRLDDRLLMDIGLSRRQIRRERGAAYRSTL